MELTHFEVVMVLNRLFAHLHRRLRAFRPARAGNVTITFALALIPIMGAVGATVDYSHVNSDRTAMQAAVDATALMLSKDVAGLKSSQLSANANSIFDALYTRPEVNDILVTTKYTATGDAQLVVSASGTVKTSFVSLIGISQVEIGASSTVKWGNTRLRVALALDNTGSMSSDNKMSALQTATENLLNQLKSAAINDGDVYVSIIPFAKDVNLGSSNHDASWIDWTDWDEVNGRCSKFGYTTKSTCTAQGSCSVSGISSLSACTSIGTCSISSDKTQSSCESDGKCSKSKYKTETDCRNNGKTWTGGKWTGATWSGATWTPNSHNTWNGCVTDRGLSDGPSSGNYDTNVVAPTANDKGTLFAAEQYDPCPQAAMGLNYDWNTMTGLVDNMRPGGNTNQAIGLALAWMALSGGGPFSVPPIDTKYKYKQVIILLTDGLNTQDRWYTSQNSIDARQKLTCDNIKAADITLYTVQVNTGRDPTSTLLQDCASDPGKFFLLTNANAIVTTFNQIGTALSNLRVAK